MNIYQIDEAITALIDPETGEILDDAAFDALNMERDEKIENVACWLKNTAAEAAAIKAEEDNLAKRRKVLERQVDRLKEYLNHALNGQKFQSAKCVVTFRKSTKVELSEPALAIAWAQTHGYGDMVTYNAPTISKTELAKVLKTGEEVPGAELVYNMSVGVK